MRIGNEEILLKSLQKRGNLRMKIRFFVLDHEGKYQPLAGNTLILKDIPNQGKLFSLVNQVSVSVERGEL